jgi:regulator of protease activity HflC (stomatin/prohibitin superfamily)
MKLVKSLTAVVVLLACGFLAYGVFHWTVDRKYVPVGHSLMLRYKGPLNPVAVRAEAKPGHFAEEGEVGVLEKLRGPGRHFYCPIWWERKIVPDFVVQAGQVAIVTSKLGNPLPAGNILVDGDLGSTEHNGIMRRVYGPGRYRANPYAYTFNIINVQTKQEGKQVKHSGWVDIPTGYVGVVTYLRDNPAENIEKGIQPHVLPPGLYPVNPHEREIDVVEIGFREASINVIKRQSPDGQVILDESGEPMPTPETGINFPSNDGFEIQMDFTAIWGILPDRAAEIVRKFGNIVAVQEKVVVPQSESICRNNGSKLGAVELLIGDSRQQFQTEVSKEFEDVLRDKGVTLLYGLVRHIYIPQEVRFPIQQSFIADELKLTRDQEKETAKIEADLREAEKKVDLEGEKIRVETVKKVANVKAEGDKKAREIDAERKQLVAAIDKQVAELDAQRQVVLGEANAKAEQMQQEAKAEKFALAVAAFGQADAYTKWQFAEGLPEVIDLRLLYAGEGTLWTDLKNITPTVPLREPVAPKPRSKKTRSGK